MFVTEQELISCSGGLLWIDASRKQDRLCLMLLLVCLKKTYTNITVQGIIDEANIGRSTFYAHFETKDELLKVFCTEIFDDVFAEVVSNEKTQDFSKKGKSIQAEITHILLSSSRKQSIYQAYPLLRKRRNVYVLFQRTLETGV